MTGKVYTLEELRMTPEQSKAFDEARARAKANGKTAPKAAKANQGFVKFPVAAIPILGRAKYGGTARLYPLLLHLSWKTGLRQFKLTNVAVATVNLPRRSKGAALRELEELGLVTVEWRERRSPLVTLIS